MFNESTANNFPILSFQEIFDFLFVYRWLLIVPFFEESHFTVHEGSVWFLTSFTESFSMLFTFRKDSNNSIEDFLNRIEPITSKIGHYISLIRFRVVVALKIEDPISIKMRMYRHVHSVWILSDLIFGTVVIMTGTVAVIYTTINAG